MDQKEQTFAFGDELDKLISRFGNEFDITYASIVGVLQMKIHLLCSEAEDRMYEAMEDNNEQ